jgi:hypothetical protein
MNKLTLTQKANSTNQESSLNEDETRSSTLVSIWEIPFYPRKGVCSPSTLPRRKQRLKLLGKKDNKYKKPCIIYAYKWLSWSHLLLGHGIQIVLLRNVIVYIKEAIQFYFFFYLSVWCISFHLGKFIWEYSNICFSKYFSLKITLK